MTIINILLALFLVAGCLMVLGGWRTRQVIGERSALEARIHAEETLPDAEDYSYSPRSARSIAATLSMAGGLVTLAFVVPVIFHLMFTA